jgi:Co/Zn/Cd efflux system component
MGIVGSVLVAVWAWGLARDTGAVLLDRQASTDVTGAIKTAVEADGRSEIVDLHVWTIGPGYRAAIVSVLTVDTCPRHEIVELIPKDLNIVHLTVEVHQSQANPKSGSLSPQTRHELRGDAPKTDSAANGRRPH